MLSSMAGITLAQAQSNLDQWLTAQATVSVEKSVSIEGRTVTYHDLEMITKMVDYWNRMVLRLSRGSGITVHQVVVND